MSQQQVAFWFHAEGCVGTAYNLPLEDVWQSVRSLHSSGAVDDSFNSLSATCTRPNAPSPKEMNRLGTIMKANSRNLTGRAPDNAACRTASCKVHLL